MFSEKSKSGRRKGAKKARPAAGRRQMVADESREMILAAAFDLFSEKGFHGTSIRSIAKRAGVSEGLIYHHFENKLDLLHAIFQSFAVPESTLFADHLRERLEASNGAETMELLIAEIFNVLMAELENGKLLGVLRIFFNSMDSMNLAERKKLVSVVHDSLWDRISSILYEHFPSEARKTVDPYIFFRILQGSLMGYVFFQELFEWKHFVALDREMYRDTTARLLSRGLESERRDERRMENSTPAKKGKR